MLLDIPHGIAGLLVGVVVGITGVGGGSLMTPILVMMFGVVPQTAVGTDLLVASITKSAGTGVHHRNGSVDWEIVRRLAMGSLPAAALTLLWLNLAHAGRVQDGVIIRGVAIALIVTSLGMLFKEKLHGIGKNLRVTDTTRFKRWQAPLTVLAGVIMGVLVTLTSIGAGALGTVMLVYLYPLRLNASRLVGTDLAHAIPLALIAGLGHLSLGNVDGALMLNLLLGSIPGVLIGATVCTRAPIHLIRHAISGVLLIVAWKMLTH